MKKAVIIYILVVGALLTMVFFYGCKPVRYLDKHHAEICQGCIEEFSRDFPRKDTVRIVFDTITIPGAQTNDIWQQLYFDCDSNGNVIYKYANAAYDSIKKTWKYNNRIFLNYAFQNGILTINNKVFQDSIITLRKQITILQSNVKVIEKPPVTVYKAPVWIWFALGLSILAIVAILAITIKK